MWIFESDSGLLLRDEKLVGHGYSGHGEGLNNPAMEAVSQTGPIPAGRYTIGLFHDHAQKGPITAHLHPYGENEMHGRDGFLIHGDNEHLNHTASEGCIILSNLLRRVVRDSGDTLLLVRHAGHYESVTA